MSSSLTVGSCTVTLSKPSATSLRLVQTESSSSAAASNAQTKEMQLANVWLRHQCSCVPACVHPSTGEHIVDPAFIPADLSANNAHIKLTETSSTSGAESSSSSAWLSFDLCVDWSDGHSSVYSSSFLASAVTPSRPYLSLVCPDRPANLNDIRLKYDAPPSKWLHSLTVYGCVLVEGGPVEIEDSLKIVKDKLGATIIPTHFGVIEDLKVNNTTNANNDQLGYTNAAVDLHTDQPFLATPPTMQLLHCIQPAEGGGGLSTVADGIAAALHMRRHNPAWFRLLASVPVDFHRKQKNFEARILTPLIKVDEHGDPVQIRSSYFTMAPLKLNSDEMASWYAAYAEFQRLVHSPDFSYSALLMPGDVIVYNNYTMLHARTEFKGVKRHLRGIYVDRQEVEDFLKERVEKHGDSY